jgi:hypothetical protein
MWEVNLLEHRLTLRHAIRAQQENEDEKPNHSGWEQGSSANSENGTDYSVPDRISNLPHDRDNGQHDLRGVLSVVKYANVRPFHLGRVYLRFATLEVARKVRGEAGGDLQADPVSQQEHVASDQVLQLQVID